MYTMIPMCYINLFWHQSIKESCTVAQIYLLSIMYIQRAPLHITVENLTLMSITLTLIIVAMNLIKTQQSAEI